jgi:hypothetical protein
MSEQDQDPTELTPDEQALQDGAIYAVAMNLAAKDKAWKAIKWAAGILAVIAIYKSSYKPLLWLTVIAPALWFWLINSSRRFVRTTTGMPYDIQTAAHHHYATNDDFHALVKARYQQLKVITCKL